MTQNRAHLAHCFVEVYAERRAEQGNSIKVPEAVLTYVAIDEARRPRGLS